MPSEEIEKFLQYGNWSGPGWTASGRAAEYRRLKVGRILSEADFAIPGVCRYDNYVAKAHDLNEVVAETALRRTLEALKLVSAELVDLPGGEKAYADPMVYGDEAGDGHRFVSLRTYREAQKKRGDPTPTDEIRLASAFILYLEQLQRSNLQYAIDCKLNTPQLAGGFVGAFKMRLQLLAAPEYFMGEAAEIGILAKSLRNEMGMRVISSAELRARLGESFVSPAAGGGEAMLKDFAAPGIDAYEPTASRAVLIGATPRQLVLLQVARREATNKAKRRELAGMLAELEKEVAALRPIPRRGRPGGAGPLAAGAGARIPSP